MAEDKGAVVAQDNSLGMGKDGRDVEALGTLDVHKVRVGRLYETLELVGAGLGGGRGIQQVHGELFASGLVYFQVIA